MNIKAQIFLLSQYGEMDSAYWGLGTSASGSIYFALCTHQPGKSSRFFFHNPRGKKITFLFSLADHIRTESESLPQGKVHTPIFEGKNNLLYFGTHFAYPYGKPQPVNYEGGHMISYDPKKNIATDLGIALSEEGILSLVMDKERMFLYMLTAPAFCFVSYDIYHKEFHNFGQVTKNGSICRTLTLDDNGNVYGSFEKNKIFRFNQATSILEYPKTTLPTSTEKIQEWGGKTRGGINNIGRNIWRTALWNNNTKTIYGIHGGTSKLFAFNPNLETIKELDFMGADIYRNHPEMIYPTLSLAQHKNVLFYAPASGFFDYARSEKVKDYTHMVSYNIFKRKRIDHGEIMDEKGRRVFGVAGSIMDAYGKFYLLGAVEVKANEAYNKQNMLQGKPFHLGLIKIDINKFI